MTTANVSAGVVKTTVTPRLLCGNCHRHIGPPKAVVIKCSHCGADNACQVA